MSDSDLTLFEANIAHAFIAGSAVFGVFWGVVNVLLVRKVDMKDGKIIQDALDKSVDDEKDDSEKILKQLDFIGEKITEGAISFLT